ncbi:hypothetical protein MSAN_01087000 [Mycena sanguinolenta]|uniref:DUF6535 domain-containing protein n=1 Tax=Mycena sanguinolenta TaxID=230812 RepID=A0A8H7D999_9AGAR|nr:hypothetical protein MSAN_01087000 [Mycena sanguinolenta]
MEGMIIFAGLFSAILTAFLIESYKTLNPDSGDAAVVLLSHISQQLAASANGSTWIPLSPPEFTPSASAVTCNALWFISLGLSLSCALVATFLEQWAREFLHRTEVHSTPLIRARIFSFLYFGLKRFHMHTVVEIIPLLLHLALLLFFSGLIAFLIPVNVGMAAIVAAILLVLAGAYSLLTIFPLRHFDSPYRTPLSGALWRAFQHCKIRWRCSNHSRIVEKSAPPTPVEENVMGAISRAAVEVSEDRTSRDEKALIWTVRTLSDEELEPFVEAIPDLLWGPDGPREAYSALFRNLINNADIMLHVRINAIYNSCDTGLLPPDALKRRRLICYRAIWAIITLLDSLDPSKIFLRSIASWASTPDPAEKDAEILECARSVQTLMQWRTFQNDKIILHQHTEYLDECKAATGGVGEVDLTPVMHFLNNLAHQRDYFVDFQGLDSPSNFTYDEHGKSSVHMIPVIAKDIHHVLMTTPYLIFSQYLRNASGLEALPYLFRATIDIIRPSRGTPAAVRYDLDATLEQMVSVLLKKYNTPEPGWMDSLMNELMLYWPPQETPKLPLHPALVGYLNGRLSNKAVLTSISRVQFHDEVWGAFAASLATQWDAVDSTPKDVLTALWRLLSLGFPLKPPRLPGLIEASAALQVDSVGPSVLAMLKTKYLRGVRDSADMSKFAEFTNMPTLPEEDSSVGDDSSSGLPLHLRVAESCILVFTEFLEHCTGPEPFPYQTAATLQYIDVATELSGIREMHQIRFSQAIRDLFNSPRCKELRTVALNSRLFDAYTDPLWVEGDLWLSNITARETLQTTLTRYVNETSADALADSDLVRIRDILSGIDFRPDAHADSSNLEIERR